MLCLRPCGFFRFSAAFINKYTAEFSRKTRKAKCSTIKKYCMLKTSYLNGHNVGWLLKSFILQTQKLNNFLKSTRECLNLTEWVIAM